MSIQHIVIGVVWRKEEILISQRLGNVPYPLHWEFPGGVQEKGESDAEGVKREIREELGIRVHVLEALEPILFPGGATPKFRRNGGGAKAGWFLLKPYTCIYLSGKPKAIECRQFRWVLPKELTKYKFPPANGPLIKSLLKRKSPIDSFPLTIRHPLRRTSQWGTTPVVPPTPGGERKFF